MYRSTFFLNNRLLGRRSKSLLAENWTAKKPETGEDYQDHIMINTAMARRP